MTPARRLEAIAWLLLAALPLGMAIANRSATAMVAAAAIAAVASRWLAGEAGLIRTRLADTLRRPGALAALAFLALGAASLAWSHHSGRTLVMGGELLLAAAAPLFLHAALPDRVPAPVWRWAAILIGAGAIWCLAELATGSVSRAALGFRAESFIFKRSATAILLVLWPVAWLLWMRRSRGPAMILTGLVGAAILASHAAAAALGLSAGLALLAIARLSVRAAAGLLVAALGAALLLAPATGDLAVRALPDRVLDTLHDMQARDRILIWQSFGEVVKVRPISGTGFGTSAVLGADPVAAEVPADRRTMLAVGHPHNGYLQVWTELGLPGTLLAGAALASLLRGTMRAPARVTTPALAAIGCAGAVMLVAHGAWQGWWITTLGAAAIWTSRLAADGPPQTAGDEPR